MRALFRLPEYDRAESQFIGRTTHDLAVKQSGFLSMLPQESVAEVKPSRFVAASGEIVDNPTIAVGMAFELPTTAALAGDPTPLVEAIVKAADQATETISKAIFEQLGKVLEAAGQSLDARGRPLSHELVFEMLDHMEWHFDEEGNWTKPTIVVGPDMAAKFQSLPPPTAEQQDAFTKMFERKRGEFLDGRRSRKLPR
jgi:hypothetical protein